MATEPWDQATRAGGGRLGAGASDYRLDVEADELGQEGQAPPHRLRRTRRSTTGPGEQGEASSWVIPTRWQAFLGRRGNQAQHSICGLDRQEWADEAPQSGTRPNGARPYALELDRALEARGTGVSASRSRPAVLSFSSDARSTSDEAADTFALGVSAASPVQAAGFSSPRGRRTAR